MHAYAVILSSNHDNHKNMIFQSCRIKNTNIVYSYGVVSIRSHSHDTSITSTLNTFKDQGGRIQNNQIINELNKINCWLKANKLSLNVKKQNL